MRQLLTKVDARKLSVGELFALRKKIIGLHAGGLPVMKIAEVCGLSWDSVNAAIKLYGQRGIEGLRPKLRGRKQGTGRILTSNQENSIRHSLYMKKPYQLGLEDPDRNYTIRLWSLERVGQYIQNECGVRLSNACISLYLDRWGLRLNPKKLPPLKRCTKEIQLWLEENFTGHREHDLNRAYWIVRKTIQRNPYLAPRKQRLSIVTAISGKKNEEDYWCVYKGSFTKERQIGFMKFLLLQSERKPIIIRTSEEHFTHLKIEQFKSKNSNKIEIIPPLLPAEREVLLDRQKIIEDARMLRAMKN